MSIKKEQKDPGDVQPDPPRYVCEDSFGKVFEQEIKEWVLPASERLSGEKRCLANCKKPDQANDLVGLALPGGGIRSATFALGACQAMARYGVLERVDYLSTGSGGGYLGSGISALLNNDKIILDKPEEHPMSRGNFPFRFDQTAQSPEEIKVFKQEREPVQHLRERSNFLAPRLGIFDVHTWHSVLEVIVRLVWSWIFVVLPPPVLALTSLTFLSHDWWKMGTPLEPGWMVWVPDSIGGGALLILLGLIIGSMFQRVRAAPKWALWIKKVCIFGVLAAAVMVGFVFGVQGINYLVEVAGEVLGGAFGGPVAVLLILARWAFTRLGDIEKVGQSASDSGGQGLVGKLGQILFNILGFAVLIGFVFLDTLDTRAKFITLGVLVSLPCGWCFGIDLWAC